MKDIEEIKSILSKNKDLLKRKYKVKSLGIFGSFSRKEQAKDSDIDILVEFEKPVGFEFIDLADELEKLLEHKVDLVSRKAVKPKYLKYVTKDLIDV